VTRIGSVFSIYLKTILIVYLNLLNIKFRMKSGLIIFLTLLSISCSPLRVYKESPEVIAWESEILKFEQLGRSETYPDNSVIFAGSSSIRLWTTLAEDMAPYPVIQRGYGGSKLSDFAIYADRILYPHQNSGIVIFIANDINGGETDKTPHEILKLFRNVEKTIHKKFPATPVFWIGITPTTARWQVWPEISEANRLIREYCSKKLNLHFIATEHLFLNESGTPRDELFVDDLLHLNSDGYQVWAAAIRSELDKVLNR
jgi:lysophospholipase L1-like esterase